METWGAEVLKSDRNDILIMGDIKREKDPPVLEATGCMNNHPRDGQQLNGISCKTAKSYVAAYEYGRGKFDWYFTLDDDVYLHQKNAETVLAQYDPAKLQGLGIPMYLGVAHDFCFSFCGEMKPATI